MVRFMMVVGVLLTLLAGSYVARYGVRLMVKETNAVMSAVDDSTSERPLDRETGAAAQARTAPKRQFQERLLTFFLIRWTRMAAA